MSIAYLCPECGRKYQVVLSFPAVNEVGRKACTVCGCNEDCLSVVDADELRKAREEK